MMKQRQKVGATICVVCSMTNSKVLIQNIYYMLAYAFKVLRQSNYSNVATEDFENIHNLLAAILSKGISQQLKQGLYREYIDNSDDLNVLRGKLNIAGTIKSQIQHKRVLSCEYDELSEDNIFNQILKLTATILIKNCNVDAEYKSELKKLMLFFTGVSDITVSNIMWSTLWFQRNNQSYKMLMNICYLVIDGLLLSTQDGEYSMADFIDDQHMHSLYESFIREYYRYHYGNEVSVSASFVDWDVPEGSEGIELLPKMKTDITLQKGDKTLIVDAKYYSRTMQHHFDSNTFHSANMYQIYTYVKNFDKNHTGNVSGMLLYARTDEAIQPDNEYMIGGNKIGIKTLDLNCDFKLIAAQLDAIAEQFFGVHELRNEMEIRYDGNHYSTPTTLFP